MVEEVKYVDQDKQELVATTFLGENLWETWTDEEKAEKKQELLDKAEAL